MNGVLNIAVMLKSDFRVKRCLGKGKNALIFEAVKKTGVDKGKVYALKRVYLIDSSAVYNSLRERAILERISLAPNQSPFVIQMFYCFKLYKSPLFVLSKGFGVDLGDITGTYRPLEEKAAKFYACEIICGLEFLHNLQIVHQDIKPENILLTDAGHVLITDFDTACDLTSKTDQVFGGTLGFKAPEIANLIATVPQSDIWSLAATIYTLISIKGFPDNKDDWELNEMERNGDWELDCSNCISKPFVEFFEHCFEHDYRKRPNIADLKELEFFADTNWSRVISRKLKPPFGLNDLVVMRNRIRERQRGSDTELLAAVFEKELPVVRLDYRDPPGRGFVPVQWEELLAAGFTDSVLKSKFRNIKFVNPCLNQSQQ